MKQPTKPSMLAQLHAQTRFITDEKLSKLMEKPLFPEKLAKATEIIKKLKLYKP